LKIRIYNLKRWAAYACHRRIPRHKQYREYEQVKDTWI
jgi:hypothetical protein